ncbi:MAG TPA: cation-binding protein [Sphingobacteriaceae bacterium]|nr:cation-binding protein [Sphingobacteriaceae bacterium]
MKRNKDLQALSRDHHHGLLLGWKIRQGLKYLSDPRIIVNYIAYFSTAALFPHFEEEEKQILTYLSISDPLKQRTLREHKNISLLIHQLTSDKEIESAGLLKIAESVDEHIRFEERELFPHLEEVLNDDQLGKIGIAIDSNHRPFLESFTNEFWKKHAQ